MKTFKSFINVSYDYSSVQVRIPDNVRTRIIEFGKKIPDDELASDGRDDRPHITIKYGLHSGSIDALTGILPMLPNKITASLGEITTFSNDKEDVLKIDIDSPELTRLNKIITDNTKNTTTYPNYEPHCTIAYMKKGTASKYKGDEFKGVSVEFNAIEFSSKDNDEYLTIHLGKK